MSTQPRSAGHATPNAVLRGGPLDGRTIRVERPAPVIVDIDGERCFYRPNGEIETGHTTLTVFVIDHVEPIL